MNSNLPVQEKARRHSLYAGYVEEEVLPHIRRSLQNPTARIGITGASFGAFHAANQFLRRPDLFDALIAMSGFYDLSGSYLDGFMNEDVYFNNPMSYLPNIHDLQLELMRHSQIHILSGQGEYELPQASRRFSTALWDKGVGNNLDLWGHDMRHDWPTWRQMLPYYLDQRMGW